MRRAHNNAGRNQYGMLPVQNPAESSTNPMMQAPAESSTDAMMQAPGNQINQFAGLEPWYPSPEVYHSAGAHASSSRNQAGHSLPSIGQEPQDYQPLITSPDDTISNPRQWSLREVPPPAAPQTFPDPVSQPFAYQNSFGQVPPASAYQGSFGEVPQLAGPPTSLYQAWQPFSPQGSFDQVSQFAGPSGSLQQGSQFVAPQDFDGSVSQPTTHQGSFGELPQFVDPQDLFNPVSQPATHQGSRGEVPQLTRPSRSRQRESRLVTPQELRGPVSHAAVYQDGSFRVVPPLAEPQKSDSQVPRVTEPTESIPEVPQPATQLGSSVQGAPSADFSRPSTQQEQLTLLLSSYPQPVDANPIRVYLVRASEDTQIPQPGEPQMSLPPVPNQQPQSALPPPPQNPPPPSIFSGRLRGSIHYEAKFPDEYMMKFLSMATENRERAKAVISAKFSADCDSLANSCLIPLFSELLLPYTFVYDNTGGPYPLLVDAALRLKAYQRKMALNAHTLHLHAPPVDPRHPLNLAFLERAPFAVFVEMYLDLFVQSFPNLQFIEIPAAWIPHLVISPYVHTMWKEKFGWDLEVKEIVQGQYMRLGRANGWTAAHCQHWFSHIAEDIAKNG